MTGEEMERAIQFLIEHHARVSTDIEGLKEAHVRTAAKLESLTETVAELAGGIMRMAAHIESDRRETRSMFESVFEEMRDSFNKLILGNEVTRDLANQVARLAVTTSQRVTALEGRLP